VLDTIGAGDIVGDMSFLDSGPAKRRRARDRSSCLSSCATSSSGLRRDTRIAAEFYRSVCERMSDRHRELATAAVVGGIGRRRTLAAALVPWVSQQSAEIAARARSAFTQGRRSCGATPTTGSGDDGGSRRARARGGIERLRLAVPRCRSGERGRAVDRRRALRVARPREPRTESARPSRREHGLAAVRAAMLASEPTGDDSFGVELERALFDLPTVKNVKDARAAARCPWRRARCRVGPAEGRAP
jgi:hypothetical protein